MIITDFNKMTLEELEIIHKKMQVYYYIKNGKITKAVIGEELLSSQNNNEYQ